MGIKKDPVVAEPSSVPLSQGRSNGVLQKGRGCSGRRFAVGSWAVAGVVSGLIASVTCDPFVEYPVGPWDAGSSLCKGNSAGGAAGRCCRCCVRRRSLIGSLVPSAHGGLVVRFEIHKSAVCAGEVGRILIFALTELIRKVSHQSGIPGRVRSPNERCAEYLISCDLESLLVRVLRSVRAELWGQGWIQHDRPAVVFNGVDMALH